LTTAGILESGRPLTFIHPIVRSGIYSDLTGTERAQGHRRAAQLLAEQPGENERVAEHLLISEPAADGWVVERLVEAGRAAERNGAPESAVVFLRRVLDEPPPAEEQSGLLLELGMAEASAGLAGWPDAQQAVDARRTPRQPPRQRWFWRTLAAPSATPRPSRFSIVRRRRSIPPAGSRSSSKLRPSSPA
jgi:hypothetical protein